VRKRTRTPLPAQQAPEACASANSATSALEETGRNKKYISAGLESATARTAPILWLSWDVRRDQDTSLPGDLSGRMALEDGFIQRLRAMSAPFGQQMVPTSGDMELANFSGARSGAITPSKVMMAARSTSPATPSSKRM